MLYPLSTLDLKTKIESHLKASYLRFTPPLPSPCPTALAPRGLTPLENDSQRPTWDTNSNTLRLYPPSGPMVARHSPAQSIHGSHIAPAPRPTTQPAPAPPSRQRHLPLARLETFQLRRPQLRVQALPLEQLRMGAVLDDAAGIEDEDLLGG